ncbi:MAG: SufD family Fe-S cluster assembly protein [Gammaproteobacteria bacterium]|nr:SufD family Fe-S cluster assembly protein [Gammaproteobacteria bacterium]
MSIALEEALLALENTSILSIFEEKTVPEDNQKFISIVFVNGLFDANQSNVEQLPPQVLFCPFNAVVSWLNGIFLYIPKNCNLSIPIHLVFKNDKDKPCYLRNTIIMEENSKLTIIEEYKSNSLSFYQENDTHLLAEISATKENHLPPETSETKENYLPTETLEEKETNIATEIQLEKNASLEYYKLQDEALTTIHHANISIQQKESSNSTLFFADCGAKHANVNLHVNLNEKHATCHVNGLYRLAHDTQYMNNSICINHSAAYGTSSMHFKGILDNHSKAEFIGKVYVHKNAQHTQAQQSNHNLLLSSKAGVTTKPELEIYADDVKCSHGATVGQLNEDSIFYLRSRGIEEKDVLQILTSAFTNDIMNKIENITIRYYLQKCMDKYASL